MTEQWIEASRALDLCSPVSSLCVRLSAGLVRARAKLLLIGGERHEDAFIPTDFWWAEGHEALEQNWEAGDFSTWIRRSIEWKAYGVTFALTDVLEMLPFDRRGAVALSLSAAGSEKWASAAEARRFAYNEGGANPNRAGSVVLENAKLGFITARAVLAQGSMDGSNLSDWSWETREWDIPQWFWENFTADGSSSQTWDTGKFAGRGKAPDGTRWITLTGVYFLKQSLQVLLPSALVDPATSSPKNQGGRPPAAFADDLMCAIWGLIHQGDLKPKNQADIERAMLDWASRNDHELGSTVARGKARKVFAILTGEVENLSS